MINALSIDLEYWWSVEYLRGFSLEEKNDYLLESLNPLIDLLDKYNTHATFFVLGKVGEKYPFLIEEIFEKGHEIASHGYSHIPLFELTPNQFEEEIKKSKIILNKYHPIGFRAPSFSLNIQTKWAFEILIKNGFKYDSSIFPIKTNLYGVPDSPLHIYRPSLNNITQHDPHGQIIEFPLTVVKLGKNIPIAGGFYLRAIPLSFLKWGIHRTNKENRPAIIYVHPWETYLGTPRVKMPFTSNIVTYFGIKKTLKKIEALLKEFSFKPAREILYDI